LNYNRVQFYYCKVKNTKNRFLKNPKQEFYSTHSLLNPDSSFQKHISKSSKFNLSMSISDKRKDQTVKYNVHNPNRLNTLH